MKYDVVVIGGGSAGYAAARTAADRGARVAIVDKGPLGGLCILRGCMPSKSILASSNLLASIKRAKEFGIRSNHADAQLSEINDRKRTLIREFANDRITSLKDPRYDLIRGRAKFENPHLLRVGTKAVHGRSFVVATGSVTNPVPIPGLEESGYLTSDEILELRKPPKSIIVLGGGPVGTELGQFLCRIGVRTTLIQRSAHIHREGDPDMAVPVEERLRAEGMRLFTETRLIRVSKNRNLTTVHFVHQERTRTARAEAIFHALGRTPNLERLALGNAGVDLVQGKIRVDDRMRTSANHIYAAGDCVGQHEIVHIAVQQGEIAGHNAVAGSRKRRMDCRLHVSAIFTEPQVASVGLTEKACHASGVEYLAESYPFDDHGKSMVLGETDGFVKILCNPKSGEILGGHIVGPEAAELIHEIIAIMFYRGTVRDLAEIPHYHPTLAEILTYPAEALIPQLKT